MENVYVIKVRTKPALSSLYPSERRYSASTVGGLSLVHFGLGALSLLLGSLALSLQGPILSVACLVPFVTGLFAWRRWYIDRNIAIFFYASLFSLTAAVLCLIATILDIAAAADSRDPLWSLEKIFDRENHSSRFEQSLSSTNATLSFDDLETTSLDGEDGEKTFRHPTKVNSYSPTPGIILDNMSNISGYILRSSTIDPASDGFTDPSTTLDNGNLWKNVTEESLEAMNDDGATVSLLYTDYRKSSHAKILLTVNVLVASLLEAFWSALSARIALRGMMNRLPESSYANGNGKLDENAGMGKRKAPRPDILDHDRGLSESLQNLTARHNLRNSGPRLPLPESSNEFRERVERFLANQAAHHVAEGSCS